MLPLSYNRRKALMKSLNYDAKRISMMYAQILFRRYDKNIFNRYPVSHYVVRFDHKCGDFVEFSWKTKIGDIILKVIRTNKNRYFIYEKNILSDMFYRFMVFILSIVGK